jgi:hypothetical protein
MRRAEIVFTVLLAVGTAILLRESLRLPVAWTSIGPGSGFFPFWLSVLAAFQVLVLIVRSVRAPVPPGRAAPFIERESARPLLIVFLPIIAVIALLNYLGIYLGGALYLAGYMTFVGRHRWISVLLVSVLLPLALFFVFERWFLLPMPKGMLLEYLLYER